MSSVPHSGVPSGAAPVEWPAKSQRAAPEMGRVYHGRDDGQRTPYSLRTSGQEHRRVVTGTGPAYRDRAEVLFVTEQGHAIQGRVTTPGSGSDGTHHWGRSHIHLGVTTHTWD